MKLALESFQDIFYFLGRIKNKLPTIPKMCFFRLRRGLRALALRHSLLSPHPGHLSPPLALASSSPKCRQAFFFTTRVSEFFTAAARRILHRERQRTSPRRRSLRSFGVTSRRSLCPAYFLRRRAASPARAKRLSVAVVGFRRRSLRSYGVTSRRCLCPAYFLRRRAASPTRAKRLSVAVVGSGMASPAGR